MLLAVVEDEPANGYAIIDELRRRSSGTFDLPEGTVYPALHRLERAGLLRSDQTTVNGRNRRVYRLSRAAVRRRCAPNVPNGRVSPARSARS